MMCCRDVVSQTKPDSHSNVASETAEPPAKKPHLDDEHKKTVKKVWTVYLCLVFFIKLLTEPAFYLGLTVAAARLLQLHPKSKSMPANFCHIFAK